MAWKAITIDKIPEKQKKDRGSWKPDADDAAAVFGMVMTGGEALIQKMPDYIAANRKAEAMLKWMKTQPILPATLTAFVRGDNVIITDIEVMSGGGDD